MSCSDSKKSKKRKSSKSGNMGDVLGKECGDGEKDEMPQETCGEDVREEADGAPSGDEQSSQSSGDPDNYEIKRSDELKEELLSPEEAVTVLSAAALANAASQREEKPCTCEACKDRREHAAEQLEEMRRLQSYWMELRQYIRMVYRMVMEGHSIENDGQGECDPRMKDLVQKLCARDPHQLFQRLEAQVQEFVIEAKVRQLELVREQQIPELAQIFLTGLLDGYEKLCAAAKQLTPLLQPLEIHHLQRFNISWEVLNKHLYQSCVYTDHSVQNNLPLYIGQLRNMLPGKNEAYSELVHRYLAFDDEMTLIGAMWRDAETLIDAYNNEEATRKAKQRMLREDLELFKVQRKLLQQQQQQQPKHGREQRDYGDPLPTLTNLGGPTSGPGPGSLRDSPEDETGNNGYCPGCSTRRGCPCDDCAVTHILTCGVTPPDSPLPIYSHRLELQQEYRVEAEGSEQPLDSPSEPDLISADGAASGDVEGSDLAPSQQQSCECHVCTAPLMTPMDLMESYECHSCVQQGVPIPGSTPGVNLNLHAGGFHLYPHIHGTGGGGDASSLYPHIYNYQSLLTQLGPKHSRMGVHIQEQLQLTTSPTETKTSHLLQSQLVSPSPSSASSVSDLLPPGMTLEPLPASTSPPHMAVVATSSPGATGFSTPPPAIPEGSPQSLPVATSVPQTRKQPSPTGSIVGSVAKDSVPPAGTVKQQVVPTSCREHTKPPLQSLQSSASTQTSPNKAKSQQQPKSSVVTVATITRTQLSQSVVKRGPATTTQHPAPASSPPPTATRTVPSNGNSVRHSTTQTANHSHASSHQPLPDVVKSAATSTTPTQHRTAPASSKVPAHSCHKNLKNVGSIEPIKRVACTDYPDSEAADLEDSSSQDDTCSERSSSTTTSTQRDSRHCDCCYCEVFGHGMPSVAPVSRNYQEMRERLRLLLTKKKAKCKIGGVAPSSVGNGTPVQPSNAAPPTSPEAAGKPSGCPSGAPVAPPPPAASGSTAPVLAKQDSVDSLPQSNVKDPRDLEALLDFIEGNQSSRCKDAKKAAKKARQKQKKLEEKERKDQEEAERLRLEELQNKTPEVTITVVNTPQQQQQPQGKGGKKKSGTDTKNKAEKSPAAPAAPSQQPSPPVAPVTSTQSSSPQMVTIKRVMETNGAEPTVTITLKGATPDKDKVLFTLVNGQGDYLCQAQENVKATSQQQPTGNQSNSSKNSNVNSKKKNKKGNSGNVPRNPSNASGGKTVHSTAKNGSVMKPSNAANGASGNNSKQNCNNNGANKSGAAQQKQRPSSAVVLNDSVSEISPLARTPYLKQLSSSASVQINNVINNMSSGKSGSVGATQKLKSESNNVVGNRSFSLENLKLPPGITITKVDGPSSASLRKTQAKSPAENPKPASPMMPNHSSTTIIAAPMVGGGPNKTVGYSTSVSQTLSGSNVIVVDTGKMKEADPSVTNGDDAGHSGSNSKKKNKKKNKNPENAGNVNKVQRQQQVTNGVTMTVKHPNGVQASKGMNPPQQQNGSVNIKVPQSPVHPLLSKHSIRPQALNTQPAIIKVNGAMVTIRNPALQQAMASASGSRFPAAQRPEVMVNGGTKQPPANKPGKKSGTPPASGAKGKENTSTVPPRFANAESNAAAAAAMLRNRLASDCNGLNGLHISKVNNSPPDGIALRGSANGLPPRMMRPQQQQQQQQQKVGVMQNGPSHPQENSMPPSHSSMARTMMQNQSAMREAMAAANEAKKKKKKKKGAGGQGHADDWNLVESVFAPKDIDLENGDIDDDERELEAFKRFCFNSVPPKRKEKVHLNIKDIVLKKKSSAIGCS